MPPVPKVILARPRLHAALADQRRLLVADERGDRRRAVERGGRRRATPLESTTVGQRRAVDAQRVEHAVVPVAAVAALQPGDAGVGGVGDVERALGEVPGDPGVDGADAQVAGAVGVGLVEQVGDLGGRRVGRDAEPVGLEHEARADRAQVLPAERRARPARRWRGPTRSWTPAGWRCRPRRPGRPRPAPPGPPRARPSAMRGGVELDQPRRRGVRQQLAVLLDGDRGVGPHDRGPQPARARRR